MTVHQQQITTDIQREKCQKYKYCIYILLISSNIIQVRLGLASTFAVMNNAQTCLYTTTTTKGNARHRLTGGMCSLKVFLLHPHTQLLLLPPPYPIISSLPLGAKLFLYSVHASTNVCPPLITYNITDSSRKLQTEGQKLDLFFHI